MRFAPFLIIFLLGCGYKPTAKYTKDILGNKIYAKVNTSLRDPQNSVLIKDALNEAIVDKFHSKISSKNEASSILNVDLNLVKFIPIAYDKNGYVISYKTLVKLKTQYSNKDGKTQTFITEGDYDFNIQTLSVISDSKRFEAIKEASQKAIDAFISRVSVRGVLNDSK
ncbi:MAG: hypothetical protein DSZ06_02040 [Sulfurospirillum sp.]|nr:MAG: hypothetical protein DSZ06_02040 [Sulfurospirillum sp.]